MTNKSIRLIQYKKFIVLIMSLFSLLNLSANADISKDIAYLDSKGWLPRQFIEAAHNQQPITRAMLTSIIVRTFDIDKRKPLADISTDFNDVSTHHWAHDEIVQAVKHQVLSGYRLGYFHPNNPITKAEGLAILSQGYGVVEHRSDDVRNTLTRICDANKLSLWSRSAIVSGIESGLIQLDNSETECTFINPNEALTAQDVLSVLIPYAKRQDEPYPEKGL